MSKASLSFGGVYCLVQIFSRLCIGLIDLKFVAPVLFGQLWDAILPKMGGLRLIVLNLDEWYPMLPICYL